MTEWDRYARLVGYAVMCLASGTVIVIGFALLLEAAWGLVKRMRGFANIFKAMQFYAEHKENE